MLVPYTNCMVSLKTYVIEDNTMYHITEIERFTATLMYLYAKVLTFKPQLTLLLVNGV